MVDVIQGALDGSGRRFAIAVARFNQLVTNRLLDGATATLQQHGVAADQISVIWVPGAFELPLACSWAAASGRFDGVIALGAVIRGGTAHFEHVCNQAARGVLDCGLATSVPISFGVLTCETMAEALERAGNDSNNKGTEAALATLEMASLRATIATP